MISYPGQLATHGKRFAGALIDGIIIVPVGYASFHFLGINEQVRQGIRPSIVDQAVVFAILMVTFIIVHGYLIAIHGQTVGKLMVGTCMVKVQDKKVQSFGKIVCLRYALIWFIQYIPYVGIIFGLIDILFIFRKDRRCLHDHIAGTIVVNR